jgi:prepilin-type N-terminal cleavage/methylation domain-containing protein
MNLAIGVMRRPERQRGFTLMELLVTITVLSLLAASILFGWRIAAGAWGRASQLVDGQRRMSATHDVLAMQMAEMTPIVPARRQGNTAVFFQGEPHTARFLSRYSLSNRSRSGLVRIEYLIAEAGDGTQQLLLNEAPLGNAEELSALMTGAEQGPEGVLLRFSPFERTERTRVLFDGLQEARFEYYRRTGPAGPGGWVSEWRSQGTELPRAMAIRFRSQPGPDGLQPTAIVAGMEHYSGVRR